MKRALTIASLGIVALSTSSPAFAQQTELSARAETLRLGMSQADVVSVLGVPTWAVRSRDDGELAEELRAYSPGIAMEYWWRNGSCNPVVVQFNRSGAVAGWDEGRSVCVDGEYEWVPPDEYACAQPGRITVCQP